MSSSEANHPGKATRKKPGAPLTRLWRAWGYSLAGLRAAWEEEAAFRQEVTLCLILAPTALWLGASGLERALLMGSLLLVLLAELFNSAIEAVVDRHGNEYHPLAGRAKDMGSGAVLIALLNAGCVWALLLVDKFV
ncbi:diacylglycerol kinase [Desulfurivibrio sp. D14AmB]|uniref:diacylglycerol kinase n=1 Tax=Desulfurivibrio sp. D14AmB TaxID=3374370 RepID=UPI00376F2468